MASCQAERNDRRACRTSAIRTSGTPARKQCASRRTFAGHIALESFSASTSGRHRSGRLTLLCGRCELLIRFTLGCMTATEDLSFPIGPFDWHAVITPAMRRPAIETIGALPVRLREAVAR